MPDFVPGIVLSEAFYRDAVRPILNKAFPGLAHAAALIGPGSEVLGFDTPLSTDHHWGPRVLLFLRDDDCARYAAAIRDVMRRQLPPICLGWSTSYSGADQHGVQQLRPGRVGDINHRVETVTVQRFFGNYLGLDVRAPLTARAWLTLPSQKLRTVNAGNVFHDGVGLREVLQRLAWYPHDVWV